uniref:C2 domain-containing protein n=1 Tax=Leersia perrieri TaxID=77586 RepID=A0A0D9VI41_9ORYZ
MEAAAAGFSSWIRGFLLPSLWEAEVAVSAAALLVAALLLLFLDQAVQSASTKSSASLSSSPPAAASFGRNVGGGYRRRAKGKQVATELGGTSKVALPCGSSHPRGRNSYVIKLELLSAKYLIGANLHGSSDPYAVISCGEQRRFSSMVPSSRNPLWGEEFNFLVRELPVEVIITMYDWDILCKCKVIGSVTVTVLGEDKTGATWFDLDSKSGQICMRFSSAKVFPTSESLFDICVGIESQRKITLNKQYLPMTEDSGCLQAIFELPHDEVIIPLQDIDEIKRSQHSLINPAITIFLHTGSGGHGTPPSCSQNGRIRYRFTSFWNRSRTFRALENALQIYRATLEAEKQVRMHLLQQRGSSDVICSKTYDLKTVERSIELAKAYQPFINEHVLVDATSKTFPGTSEKFFSVILSDNSMFFQQYRHGRKDTDLKLSKWYPSDEYGGKIREVMFRSLCHSPLCPPDTAVTEWQRASFSKDNANLIYETKHQAHDVPFGSYFEIHCRWSLRTTSSSTCHVDIKIGVNMKKWCILQSKIKSGATDEYKREVCKILEAACDYVLKEESNSQASHEIKHPVS